MRLLTDLRDSISRIVDRLFLESELKRIGIYGPSNAGKTTLTNRIARDWAGDAAGPESHAPHETRRVRREENVEIERSSEKVTIDIVDTPGVMTKIDYKEFLEHSMEEDDAVRRPYEATGGVAGVMHWPHEDIDGVIYMSDSTKDPISQINTMLIGITENQDLPMLIFASKIGLEDSNVERVANAYPQHETVKLSALEGENMDGVYAKVAKYFVWSAMPEATASDNGSDEVQIDLFSGNRMANLTSIEKARLILDDVCDGNIAVLEEGLSPNGKLKPVEITIAEINPDEFNGIEIETCPHLQTADQSFLDRLMGRQSTQKLTTIGPANQIQMLHKDGNLINALAS